jgi:hypothetical protein
VRRFPLHPLFFATFPVLYLFVENAERVRFGKVVLPMLVVLVCVAIAMAIAFVLLRDVRKTAIVGSGFAVLGLSYGHFSTYVRDLFLFPLWMVLGVLVLLGAWRLHAVPELTLILNVIGLGLFAVSAYNTANAVAGQDTLPVQARVGERSEEIRTVRDAGKLRDVYYLVFDRYGSERVLAEHLGIDNSGFVAELERRGFFVADEARANYPTTAHSLASSLNLRYLDHLKESEGVDSTDWKPLYETIVDPALARFLRSKGYRYAHIGPWYDPTAHDPTAHINYHYDRRSEFSRVFITTTIVQPLAERLGFLQELDGRRVNHNQVRFQFDSILDASRLDGPTYTFAHLLIPHLPYTFDADGSYVDEDPEDWVEGFEAQLRYTNRRILDIVDRLLAGSDDEDPIIVLQADEGPKDESWRYGGSRRWEEATDDQLDLKFGVLNAVHAPQGSDELYPSITSVNTWRAILRANFGADLEPLPDRILVFGRSDEPYRFTDVTRRLAR